MCVSHVLPFCILLYAVAIDEVDVNALNVSQITALMSKRSYKERRLTVVTSSKTRSRTAPQGFVGASESDGSPV